MRTTLLRLAVALATFILGVTLASVWLAFFGAPKRQPAQKREACLFRVRERVELVPAAEPLPPPPAAVVPVAPLTGVETLVAETCEGTAAGRMVSGGALNGKAISKPAPKYPAAAMEARASGTVVVQVTVDECGDVEDARAVSGHPLLREAAAEAAYRSRFSPTRLGGEPVKVTGTITYNFVLQ